jgi:hypothetical protein
LPAPTEPQQIPNLASFRHDSGPRIPVTPGRTASSGRRTSSRISSLVIDARSDSLRWMSRVLKPCVSVGTTNPRTPSSVRAHTTATSATPPFVIHIFVPLRIQSLPSRRARVRMLAGSDPKSGSVSPKQPIASPAAIRGSHCCLCSSEPNFQIGNIASEPCTDTSERRPLSPASSSRQATP